MQVTQVLNGPQSQETTQQKPAQLLSQPESGPGQDLDLTMVILADHFQRGNGLQYTHLETN